VANYPLDLFLIAVFLLVQWRVTVILLRATLRSTLRATQRAALRYLIFAFNIFIAVSYSFTFPIVLYPLHVPTRMGMILGAGSLTYFITVTCVLVIHQVLVFVRRQLHADTHPGRRHALNAVGGALMVAPFAAVGYGSLIQRTNFQVREVDVPLPGLPQDLDGLRILQLSDIHLSAFLSEAELIPVIDASLGLHPHVTVVTGDLISGHTDPLEACIRQLARLKSDAGTFGCMGNHERYAKLEDRAQKAADRVGIRFLRNQSQALRFGNSVLNLAGQDFYANRERDRYLEGAEHLILPGATNILLQHNPDVFPVAVRKGYNLLLAGHTHGGQVTVEIFDRSINPARFFTPFVHGLYRSGNSAAYVTRGIGTIGIPTRIGAPPEITLLRLRKA
jgi:predicted MPP superfamily phosphohydrolase